VSRIRFYITPFKDDGTYDSEIQVTKDVIKLGRFREQLDNTEFSVGIIRFSDFSFTLRNEKGKYSDVGTNDTIFKFKRAGSKLRITWDPSDKDLCVGFFTVPDIVPDEIAVFEGVLDDRTSKTTLDEQDVDFRGLGHHKLFEEIDVPFSTINNVDLLSVVIFKCLNQALLTDFPITVLQANITVDTDQTIDDKSSLENLTVLEALKELLQAGNATLRIDGTTIKVSARVATAAVQKTFFGQAAAGGIQNIIDIKKYKSGLNRMFNYLTWEETTLLKQNTSTSDTFGIKKKEIGFAFITANAKRNDILQAYIDEFGAPKTEFDLIVPLQFDTLTLTLLDRIAVDYPVPVVPSIGVETPKYAIAIYGTAVLPFGILNLSIPVAENWKIMSRALDFRRNLITFEVRRV